jgi:NAD+ synthase
MKNKIVAWLKREISHARAKGIVLGLSGGVDSAVVAALSKLAVGENRVLGLVIPIHSNPRDAHDARVVARKLGIKTKTIDLTDSFDKILAVLPAAGSLAKINLKPRLRMLVLYYFANTLNYLVCGTGNKAEISVGYFTKYGDGAVDLLPIGDLLKRQVRQLARELGIPEAIIVKPPSAGLHPGQTDEGEMGISYDALDDILERIARKKKHVRSHAQVAKVKRMVQKSEHKRRLPRLFISH